MTKGRGIFKVEAPKKPEREYEIELRKLQAFTPQELDNLLTEVERKSKEGRGLFSRGNLLNGYAIDPKTLKSPQSSRHDNIDLDLASDITTEIAPDHAPSFLELRNLERRIVKGFVYVSVPGFKVPIVKLYLGLEEMGSLVPEHNVKRILWHLKNERKLLPISAEFRVL
ncbi:hypothetical protein A3C67_02650 [Candidatus Nomurabacteria bacterium RIFCSPHIGHO2_02_FULL_42_19]|uniref:Uncharacterized protein n=1 Tax=Candidatus Nomurabacteria bacterium RIFCSPHIGHO2_02_FULL_42_19 TaxID=1801756 RepID=A0A1F6W179_9BACT|nr:MAG: hypothetical protein A3C67_02650 [Candidatus Nomurabacteria bacterium RIFCSPHIGHO2_02_FULL_42_19]